MALFKMRETADQFLGKKVKYAYFVTWHPLSVC